MNRKCFARYGGLVFVAVLIGVLPGQEVQAQIDRHLSTYGYFQGQFRYTNEQGGTGLGPGEKASFVLQQLNVMFSTEFSAAFSAFVNIEATNSFSSEQRFGSFKIEEAWVRYDPIRSVNLKLGLQIPTFNNLNQIKNRTPLLPYIARPVVYESTFSSALPISEFVPQQAFIELSGTLLLKDVKLDYALYTGNQDSFVSDTTLGSSVAGMDTTVAKMFGARIGVRYNGLKAGISGTFDQSKQQSNQILTGLGEIPRLRLGADLSFAGYKFFFEGEWIAVQYDLSSLQRFVLETYSRQFPGLVGRDLDKSFYYALAGYNITEKWYFYAGYNYMKDTFLGPLEDGYRGYMLGGGYRPFDFVVLKAQFMTARIKSDVVLEGVPFDFTGTYLLLAASVLF